MGTLSLLLALLLADNGGPPPRAAGATGPSPERLYAALSPAVVGIDCWQGPIEKPEDPYAYGSGAIIDPRGLVLTSTTVVPPDARRIRVTVSGGRAVEAERVLTAPEVEVVLLRLRPPAGERGRPFPFVRIGDSSRLRIGQIAYTLGNAFRSISEDQQVSLAVGAVSGSYVLTESRNESHYRGPAIETTAAVNDGMDGGPLVDGSGEVVGLISLNFSRNRWLGTAVPVNTILPLIAEELGSFSDRLERFPAFLGIELRPALLAGASGQAPPPGSPEALRPVVVRVQLESPAAMAGFKEGDRLVSWNGAPVAGGREFRALFQKARPGERVRIGIERGKDRRELEAALWGSY